MRLPQLRLFHSAVLMVTVGLSESVGWLPSFTHVLTPVTTVCVVPTDVPAVSVTSLAWYLHCRWARSPSALTALSVFVVPSTWSPQVEVPQHPLGFFFFFAQSADGRLSVTLSELQDSVIPLTSVALPIQFVVTPLSPPQSASSGLIPLSKAALSGLLLIPRPVALFSSLLPS